VIDVLIPSRGHPELLVRSVDSLLSLAGSPEQVMIYVAADGDDPETIAVASELGTCQVFSDRPGYAGLHVYYQGLAELGTADWLLVWNDDTTMLTAFWDTILHEQSPSVLIADLQSNHSPTMCCFPAVRREAVEALGRFCSDNPHVDTFWQDVGRATGTIAPVPVRVQHDQVTTSEHFGNQHDYYGRAHQAQLAACTETIRRYAEDAALEQSH